MEVDQLPTKPGPYYWREKDGDEWEIHTVFIDDELNNTLMASCPIDDTWYATENWGGQWLPIPTAEELVELQAKAKAYDEGQHEWGMFDSEGKFAVTCPNEQKYLANGWTCRKVRVCKEVDE